MITSFRNTIIISTLSIVLLVIGCKSSDNNIIVSEKPIYVFGDSTYHTQLEAGTPPMKLGPIAADNVPSGFPQKFLEPDGSYAGGHIYPSVEEAEQAILEAKQKGLISEEGDWGVYQVQGNWDTCAYELRPKEFYLRKSTPVIKRVK